VERRPGSEDARQRARVLHVNGIGHVQKAVTEQMQPNVSA
jgi:hypothetical protein